MGAKSFSLVVSKWAKFVIKGFYEYHNYKIQEFKAIIL